MNTPPRADGSFRTVDLTGTPQSQYADLNVTNLIYDTYLINERVEQISAARVQATLKSEPSLTLDPQNLNLTFADGNPPEKPLTQPTVQSLNFNGISKLDYATLSMLLFASHLQRNLLLPAPSGNQPHEARRQRD